MCCCGEMVWFPVYSKEKVTIFRFKTTVISELRKRIFWKYFEKYKINLYEGKIQTRDVIFHCRTWFNFDESMNQSTKIHLLKSIMLIKKRGIFINLIRPRKCSFWWLSSQEFCICYLRIWFILRILKCF